MIKNKKYKRIIVFDDDCTPVKNRQVDLPDCLATLV